VVQASRLQPLLFCCFAVSLWLSLQLLPLLLLLPRLKPGARSLPLSLPLL